MDVTYRPARAEDLEPGVRVVEQAFNDLRGQNGCSACRKRTKRP